MALKYSENFISHKWQRASSRVIQQEKNIITELLKESQAAGDANIVSQKKLLEIEHELAKGHELFFAHKYSQAIDQYKVAQGMIYQMLHPGFSIKQSRRPEISFSLDKTLFEPLLSSCMELIEALAPETTDIPFGPAFVDVPENIIKEYRKYSDLGIHIDDAINHEVKYYSQLAAHYVQKNQWQRADYFYDKALKILGSPQTLEGQTARGALLLSKGGVNIQTGNTAGAKKYLDSAQQIFKKNKDTLGLAQVNINLAAAHAKEGNGEKTTTLLKEAGEFLSQSRGIKKKRRSGENLRDISRTTPIREATETIADEKIFVRADVKKADLTSKVAGTIKTDILEEAIDTEGLAVVYRQPGKEIGWSSQEMISDVEREMGAYKKTLNLKIGNQYVDIRWQAGTAVPADQIIGNIYKKRITGKLDDIRPGYFIPGDFAVNLPHLYFYVIPVCLGDCYHALGEYETAESYYLQAADYEYINTTIEVPDLWKKLAENVLEWGNFYFKNDMIPEALKIYRRVMELPGGDDLIWPESPLYKHVKLAITGNKVKQLLVQLDKGGVAQINPLLSAIVQEIRIQVLKIHGGLDYLGMPLDLVPIWSFEYLQNMARYFAEQAIQAERDFINFQDRAENEALTRLQLNQAVNIASSEIDLAKRQKEAYDAEKEIYVKGKELADKRKQNAINNRNDYSGMSWERMWLRQSNAWYSSQNTWELEKTIKGGPDNGRHIHEVVAENTQRIESITRDYELAAMQRQIDELGLASQMAAAHLAAAEARVKIGTAMVTLAETKHKAAQDTVIAFENQYFTPEVWYQMGLFMRDIFHRYLTMAISIARMMQKAYNFENDLDRHIIKTDYSTVAVKGLLGADALLADINTFSYDLVTTIKRKNIPVKHSISLMQRYPYQFETEFRTTGKMNFETRLEDFDLAFPGTYSRRIERLELEIEGMLPAGGVRGVLTNFGISRYRTTDINTIKFRVQPRDTMILSEYRLKNDGMIFPDDNRKLSLFEGCGTAGSWELEIPKYANDLDFNAISDIRLIFYYTAHYDAALAQGVKTKITSFPGTNTGTASFSLRWMFPDSFFYFQDTGQLSFSLDPTFFPLNRENQLIKGISLLVMTKPGTNPALLHIRGSVPAHPDTIPAQPNAKGEILVKSGHPWIPLQTGTVTGDYLFEIRESENPSFVVDGTLDLSSITNMVFIMEYSFTPRV